MSRTANKQAAALARARQRRIEVDQERDARDHRVEEATAQALLALEQRQQAEQVVGETNRRLGQILHDLLADVTINQAAALCELEPSEARSLAKAAQQEPTDPTKPNRAEPTGAVDLEHASSCLPPRT